MYESEGEAMKHEVLAMKMSRGRQKITINGIVAEMPLPDWCIGIMFVFESKKAARAYYGNDVNLIRIKTQEEKP